ncbi:hypothetical protein HNY73_018726 [Argiope bruennichi]|uniref:Uncharacterized protein n=1 Tax=Argiope bruennichi TaxID=94029 RepID=A0A8T0EF02_ARGBR|nr:hypothetical protein HNY73_018726 [Argiope bruennichi]
MSHTEDIVEDKSEEDDRTTRFLELLLRYDYVCKQDCEENFLLNLSAKEKIKFLNDCTEIYQDFDELKATIKITNIRELYDKEMQETSKNADESKYPWFSLADKLFKTASAAATSDIPDSVSLKQIEELPVMRTSSVLEERSRSEGTVSSITIRDMNLETDAASNYLQYVRKESKSLPRFRRHLRLSIKVPTAALFLCPPIATQDGNDSVPQRQLMILFLQWQLMILFLQWQLMILFLQWQLYLFAPSAAADDSFLQEHDRAPSAAADDRAPSAAADDRAPSGS